MPRPCTLPAIIRQPHNIHHLDNDLLDDPGLIIMELLQGDLTNVQSPLAAARHEDVHPGDIDDPRGTAPTPGANLDTVMILQEEIVRVLLLSSLPHLNDAMTHNQLRSIINYMTTPPLSQLFRLLRGGRTNIPPSTTTQRRIPIILRSLPVPNGNRGAGGKNYPKNPSSKYQSTWEDPKQSSNRYDSSHDPATKPLTAFSTSKSALTRHKKTTPDNSGDDQSQLSESIPSGHMLINLRDGSKAEWIRGVRFGLRHPDRMKAASEIPYAEQPKPIKTIGIEEFQGAVATLQRTDPKIPSEITRKAIHLISSTNLLPVFDLERSFIIDLPSTNMLALILPLPEISRFSMPPPFKDAQNHTWALLHGTPIETAQAILLEGKIRPANWSFNKNLSRCDMPTFGAFYLGREIAKSDTFPDWAAKELMNTIQKKGKGQQVVIVGAMYRGACPHTAFKAGGNEMTEMAQISVADKGVATTSEKETIAHSNHVGLKFCQASSSRPYSSSIADESSGIMAFERRKERFWNGCFSRRG